MYSSILCLHAMRCLLFSCCSCAPLWFTCTNAHTHCLRKFYQVVKEKKETISVSVSLLQRIKWKLKGNNLSPGWRAQTAVSAFRWRSFVFALEHIAACFKLSSFHSIPLRKEFTHVSSPNPSCEFSSSTNIQRLVTPKIVFARNTV